MSLDIEAINVMAIRNQNLTLLVQSTEGRK